MPAISTLRTELYKETISRLIVVNPNMSLLAMQAQLNEAGYGKLDPHYISKLKNQILAGQMHKARRIDLHRELGSFIEMATVLCQSQWQILLSKTARNNDKTAAGRLILMTRTGVMDQLFASGIFEKDLGTLTVKVEHSADPGTLALVAGIRQLYAVPAEYRDMKAPESPEIGTLHVVVPENEHGPEPAT